MFQWEDGTVLERPYVTVDGQKYYLQDGTYSGGTPVSSSNLNAMQSQLVSYMQTKISEAQTWKLLGNTTGTSPINLPQSFNELLCVLAVDGNQSVSVSINIPKNVLTSSDSGFNSGYYSSSTVNCFVRVTANTGTINLTTARLNNSDVASNTIISVYYR